MKTNIKRINYHGRKDKEGNWWSWTEICDRCKKEIFNNNDRITMSQPNLDEPDFCVDCYV